MLAGSTRMLLLRLPRLLLLLGLLIFALESLLRAKIGILSPWPRGGGRKRVHVVARRGPAVLPVGWRGPGRKLLVLAAHYFLQLLSTAALASRHGLLLLQGGRDYLLPVALFGVVLDVLRVSDRGRRCSGRVIGISRTLFRIRDGRLVR